MLKRLNKACKFFPCHRGLEDCTFCYCPFYPCLDENLGGYVYSPKRKENIWSCKDCNWIHKRKVTERTFALIRKNGAPGPLGRGHLRLFGEIPRSGKVGIIILSHGSKIKEANASLAKTVRVIKQKTGLNIIVPAYLQFYQPDLTKSIRNLIIHGCQTIIIIPFFLFNGNHVTRDIPCIIEKEKAKYQKVTFIYTKNLGLDIRIADIIVDIIEEAVHSENNY